MPPFAPCIGQGVSFAFEGTEVLYSNLGGQGPDTPTGVFAGSKAIRYVNVGTYYEEDGVARYLDLEVTALDAYTPYDVSLNGLSGQFARINLACNNAVQLRVTTVASCATFCKLGPTCRNT